MDVRSVEGEDSVVVDDRFFVVALLGVAEGSVVQRFERLWLVGQLAGVGLDRLVDSVHLSQNVASQSRLPYAGVDLAVLGV